MFGVVTAALALGIRHGIDWDHIAAITDITSTSTDSVDGREQRLTREPGIQFTDESHHRLRAGASAVHEQADTQPHPASPRRLRLISEQRRALLLGTLYALGHGFVVLTLGLAAILASEVLPDWIDPIMGRVVGVTLIFLALYLFYSLYRYFRSGGEFRIRSRWMLVFAAVNNAYHRVLTKIQHKHEHHHTDSTQQYGMRTAFGIGLIHGIGAETGTQALIIASAAGATSKGVAVVSLVVFVVGLLISNSFVTIATATGFVSARRRQTIYVVIGAVAAVFSLIVGVVFLLGADSVLPDLDRYFRWLGGPSTE